LRRRCCPDDHPIQQRARAVLRAAQHLQCALDRYRVTANAIITAACHDDIPF
jgi:hypothetical protein